MISSRNPAAFLRPAKNRVGPETSVRNTFFEYLEVIITETNSTLAEVRTRRVGDVCPLSYEGNTDVQARFSRRHDRHVYKAVFRLTVL